MAQKKKTDKVAPVAAQPKKEPARRPSKKLTLGVLTVLTAALWGMVAYFAWERYMKPSEAEKTDGGKVVAVVAGEPVRLSDVYDMAASIPQLNELPFEMVYPQILENIINMKVLLKGARDMGLEKDPKVARALALAHDQILSQAYLSRRLEASVTPEKLQELYAEEMKHYQPEERVRARHILVKTLKEAKDIRIQLENGADFTVLANAKSLDANGNGGDLGAFTKNMMIPEFGNAVFAMKKGQLSEPIKTPFGWHIVLVEDKDFTTPPAFEEIQEQLQQLYMEKNAVNILKEARAAADVKIVQPTLKKTPIAPAAPAAAATKVVEPTPVPVADGNVADTPAEPVNDDASAATAAADTAEQGA